MNLLVIPGMQKGRGHPDRVITGDPGKGVPLKHASRQTYQGGRSGSFCGPRFSPSGAAAAKRPGVYGDDETAADYGGSWSRGCPSLRGRGRKTEIPSTVGAGSGYLKL
jgi:hypothetical protein